MRFVFLLCLLPFLVSCNENPEKEVLVKNKSVVRLPIRPERLLGMYTGEFKGSPLCIVIDHINHEQARGYDLHRGIYRSLSEFWTKIFALSFGLGVVSGIVMSYQFGTNWSRWSDTVGNVLGPLIQYEVVTAFFLEAAFLGILLFGRDRVPRGIHLMAACLVAIWSVQHCSGCWLTLQRAGSTLSWSTKSTG